MRLKISTRLEDACRTTAATRDWLERLPESVGELVQRWQLALGEPFESEETTCSWVVSVTRADGKPAVLKLAMPHFEGLHEIDGLRFWDGNPTVRLLESDAGLGAMLLERCEPGTPLRSLPEPEQDTEIASLLRRLWRTPPLQHPFRPLAAMLEHWAADALDQRENWHDPVLVSDGLQLFQELSSPGSDRVILATDLHAGNVLRAEREKWLVIDPKPFVGDPAYDATQHLLNCRERLLAHPEGTIRGFADLLQVSPERIRLWTFARVVVELSEASPQPGTEALARRLAP